MVPVSLNLTILNDILGRKKLFRCPQCSEDLVRPDPAVLAVLILQTNLGLLGRKLCPYCALCWDLVFYQRNYGGAEYRIFGVMAFDLRCQRTKYSLPLGGQTDSDVYPPRFTALELAETYFRLRRDGFSGPAADTLIELAIAAKQQCLTLAEVRALLTDSGNAPWETLDHLAGCPSCRKCVTEVRALGTCPTQTELIHCRKRILTREHEQAIFRHIFQGPGCPRCKQVWASLSSK